jgi:hypothetical protein
MANVAMLMPLLPLLPLLPLPMLLLLVVMVFGPAVALVRLRSSRSKTVLQACLHGACCHKGTPGLCSL